MKMELTVALENWNLAAGMWNHSGYLDYRNLRKECCVYQLFLQSAFS